MQQMIAYKFLHIIIIQISERYQQSILITMQKSGDFSQYLSTRMESVNEDVIKRKLAALDLEQNQYASAQLSQTLHNTKKMLPKDYSFGDISDWNERYPMEETSLPHQHSEESKKYDFASELRDFAFMISPKKRGYFSQLYSPSPKKDKVYLAPIKMQFPISKSKNKLNKQPCIINRLSEERPQKSQYELNYDSLSKLFKSKSNKKGQGSTSEQRQVIFPLKQNHVRFPKTERLSSILRSMKRNNLLLELKRKRKVDNISQNMFIFPN